MNYRYWGWYQLCSTAHSSNILPCSYLGSGWQKPQHLTADVSLEHLEHSLKITEVAVLVVLSCSTMLLSASSSSWSGAWLLQPQSHQMQLFLLLQYNCPAVEALNDTAQHASRVQLSLECVTEGSHTSVSRSWPSTGTMENLYGLTAWTETPFIWTVDETGAAHNWHALLY